MSTIGSYRIPEERLSELTAKLDKLARRSAKLGMPPISYEVGAPLDVPFARPPGGGRRIELKPEQVAEAKRLGQFFYLRFFPLTLSGETPRLAGWEFIATLQHLTDDTGSVINMLRMVPSFKEALPVEYRSATPENCDHCHKRIKTRKETFIVRHEDGRWMQVGRRCTQDFLGGVDPHAVAAQLEALLSACSACEESEFSGGSGGSARMPTDLLLTYAAAIVRVDGWTSRGRARNDETLCATADSVLSMFNPPTGEPALSKWKKWAKEREVTPADSEIAEKALAHAREVLGGKDDRNDYEHNLYVATTQESIDHKLVGITSSLIAYYLREVERLVLAESRKISAANSIHFGTVGKRAEFKVTCTRMITNEGDWGTTYIHALITSDGNLATWFASGNPEMKIGQAYRVKATVKSHGEYKGAKQTTLTRLVVLEDAPEAPTSGVEKVATPDDDLTARRKAAAAKAVATRRANAAKGAAN